MTQNIDANYNITKIMSINVHEHSKYQEPSITITLIENYIIDSDTLSPSITITEYMKFKKIKSDEIMFVISNFALYENLFKSYYSSEMMTKLYKSNIIFLRFNNIKKMTKNKLLDDIMTSNLSIPRVVTNCYDYTLFSF